MVVASYSHGVLGSQETVPLPTSSLIVSDCTSAWIDGLFIGQSGIQAGCGNEGPKIPWHSWSLGKTPLFKISKEGGNKSINMNGQKRHEAATVKHKLWAFLFGRLN